MTFFQSPFDKGAFPIVRILKLIFQKRGEILTNLDKKYYFGCTSNRSFLTWSNSVPSGGSNLMIKKGGLTLFLVLLKIWAENY